MVVVVARPGVVLDGVGLGAVEQRGQGDLDGVERVPDPEGPELRVAIT